MNPYEQAMKSQYTAAQNAMRSQQRMAQALYGGGRRTPPQQPQLPPVNTGWAGDAGSPTPPAGALAQMTPPPRQPEVYNIPAQMTPPPRQPEVYNQPPQLPPVNTGWAGNAGSPTPAIAAQPPVLPPTPPVGGARPPQPPQLPPVNTGWAGNAGSPTPPRGAMRPPLGVGGFNWRNQGIVPRY